MNIGKVTKNCFATILLITIMSLLLMINLKNKPLDYEEAYTLLIGKNIIKHGVPVAWNGEYLITLSNGNDFNDNFITKRFGVIQYYLAAIGYLTNNWLQPRFIFGALGIISAFVFYKLAKRLTKNDKTSIIALAFYCTSVPIIMCFRKISFYSPGILFCLISLLTFLTAIEQGALKYWIYFIASSIVLYYSNAVFFVIIMSAIILRYIFFDKNIKNIKIFLISMIVSLSFTIIYTFYTQNFFIYIDHDESIYEFTPFILQVFNTFLLLDFCFFPVSGLILVCFLIFLFKLVTTPKKCQLGNDLLKQSNKKKISTATLFMILVEVINIIVISTFPEKYAIKYLIPSIFIGYILSATILEKLLSIDILFGVILILVVTFSNLLNITPYIVAKKLNLSKLAFNESSRVSTPYTIYERETIKKSTLTSYLENNLKIVSYTKLYLSEIFYDNKDISEYIVDFLNQYAQKDDIVQADNYIADIISYCTNLKVVNRINIIHKNLSYKSDDKYSNEEKYIHLTYYPEELVKWFVILSFSKQELEIKKSSFDRNKYEVYEVTSYSHNHSNTVICEHGCLGEYALIIKNKSIQ